MGLALSEVKKGNRVTGCRIRVVPRYFAPNAYENRAFGAFVLWCLTIGWKGLLVVMKGYEKYRPFAPVRLTDRKWPDQVVTQAPLWCSVDLRDGNQALVNPMNLEQKLLFFKMLTEIGFKEIEVGFPSASETEYEILRALIERNLIPDDVTIQVLVQCREHLIERTFEALQGAKNVIVHFYNSTSQLQRRVVFETDVEGVTEIALQGARLIRKLAEEEMDRSGMNLRYEYSPESFSGTEPEVAVRICDAVCRELGASPEKKVILNLPNTVENATPNCYADLVEYFCRNLENRENAVICLHPHNDRGTATAAAELGLMAGAERVEGTIFGNGERTGNVDLMVLALNLFTQGVDPGLDFSSMNRIKERYEECTGMTVHERHPYAGKLVFTAFSGSHQDAINKGVNYMARTGEKMWQVPYLPIDPADIGRQYEPIVRINSQSGKGGAAFVMQNAFGYILPKEMHAEFGAFVQRRCDDLGRELQPDEIFGLFEEEYVRVKRPYHLKKYRLFEENNTEDTVTVDFEGVVSFQGQDYYINGKGNGPVDAFFTAIRSIGLTEYQFVSYQEHAVSSGADSKAVSYIHLNHQGEDVFGVGIDSNISLASIKGIICAVNRVERRNNPSLQKKSD